MAVSKLGYHKLNLQKITSGGFFNEMRALVSGPQEIRYDGIHCNLIIQRFPRVVVLRISGSDVGEFGEAPM